MGDVDIKIEFQNFLAGDYASKGRRKTGIERALLLTPPLNTHEVPGVRSVMTSHLYGYNYTVYNMGYIAGEKNPPGLAPWRPRSLVPPHARARVPLLTLALPRYLPLSPCTQL